MKYISPISYFIIGLKQESEKDNGYPISYNYWIRARGLIRMRANSYDIVFESGNDLLYAKDYIINKTLDKISMQKPIVTENGLLMLRVNPKHIEGILPYDEESWRTIIDKDAYIETSYDADETDSRLHDQDPREEL